MVAIANSQLSSSKKSLDTNATPGDRIRVCVRKRPLNKKELAKNEQDIAVVKGRRSLVVHEPK